MSNASANGDTPLAGVRILDLSTSYAGPTAAMFLADMGATVLKIERPGPGDDTRAWGPPFLEGESVWFHSANRRKKSLAVDLKSKDGRELVSDLLDSSDVLVESFNPAKLVSLHLEPERIRVSHPQLIYCALSGFGLSGPDANLPGYDLIAQARSGLMSVTGAVSGPPQRVSTALCDVVAGTIAAFCISAALVRQRATGQGEIIDVSLLDAGLALMNPRVSSYLAGEEEPRPSGATDSVLAVYQPFEAADRSIVIAIGNDAMWLRFCVVANLPELANDESLRTNAGRRQHRATVLDVIAKRIRTRSSTEWLEVFATAGIPASSVQGLSEVTTDPQVLSRSCITPLDNGIRVVGPPWRLAGDTSTAVVPAVGPVGSDFVAALRLYGLSDERIAELATRVDDPSSQAEARQA
jgi:crotonobetainyl-CoA:carnitine CoA-transferase CaiB-like acyl-CoA transferase